MATNALLWLLGGSSQLGSKARANREGRTVCVSDLSLLKITINAAKRKLDVPSKLGSLIDGLGIFRIGIRDDCLDRMRELPLQHKDPFDRYLIAQSLVDAAPVVTSDPAFAQYGVQVIDARV